MTQPILPLGPPYYAVIFTSKLTPDQEGYAQMGMKMENMVRTQPGFLGFDSTRDMEGFGITISYWRDMKSIHAWKAVEEHREAQALGRDRWYSHYSVRIAEILEERGLRA